MRASELFGRPVVDVNGVDVGRVHDLRLDVGRDQIGVAESLPVRSLVIGPAAIGSRLGYAHGDVEGPWILARIIGAVSRHAREVRWDDVADLGPPVQLRTRRQDLGHPRDLR